MIGCPMMIRGQYYPSQRAAAAALGVCPQCISRALDRGRLDYIGVHKKTRPQGGHPGNPCRMNGNVWPSQAAAARALDVRRSSILKALAAGRAYVRPGRHATHPQGVPDGR